MEHLSCSRTCSQFPCVNACNLSILCALHSNLDLLMKTWGTEGMPAFPMVHTILSGNSTEIETQLTEFQCLQVNLCLLGQLCYLRHSG